MSRHVHAYTVAFLLLLASTPLPSQVIIKREVGKGSVEGQPFVLVELGAVIVTSEGKLTIEHILPNDRLPKSVDANLKEGDVILMANAKKLKTVKELEDLYQSLGIGSELKLGVQRGDGRFIVSIAKADPKDLPQMRIKIGGDGGDIEALPAVGVILKSQKNKIIVDGKFPDTTAAVATADIKEHDELVEMNKQPVSTIKKFMDTYMALPVGSTVEWKLKRGKETIAVSFNKPKPREGIMRREIKK